MATVVGLVARTKDKISLTCFLCHPPALFGRIANCSSGSSARLISSALLSCYDSSVIPGQLGFSGRTRVFDATETGFLFLLPPVPPHKKLSACQEVRNTRLADRDTRGSRFRILLCLVILTVTSPRRLWRRSAISLTPRENEKSLFFTRYHRR